MTARIARLRLDRLRLDQVKRRPAMALEPAEAHLQILTAELPEARAIERSDRRERTERAERTGREPAGAPLTFEILTDDDLED